MTSGSSSSSGPSLALESKFFSFLVLALARCGVKTGEWLNEPFLNLDNKRTFANVVDVFGVVLGAVRIGFGAVPRKKDIRPKSSVV